LSPDWAGNDAQEGYVYLSLPWWQRRDPWAGAKEKLLGQVCEERGTSGPQLTLGGEQAGVYTQGDI
jgi:hypothetical protein